MDKTLDLVIVSTVDKEVSLTKLNKFWDSISDYIKDTTIIAFISNEEDFYNIVKSNLKDFKYEWILPYNKGYLIIPIFYNKFGVYYPQKTTGHKPTNPALRKKDNGKNYGKTRKNLYSKPTTKRFPRSVLTHINKEDIVNYLIKTYKPKNGSIKIFI